MRCGRKVYALLRRDASFRRYLRIDTDSGHSLIVMDAPPEKKTASLLCKCRP